MTITASNHNLHNQGKDQRDKTNNRLLAVVAVVAMSMVVWLMPQFRYISCFVRSLDLAVPHKLLHRRLNRPCLLLNLWQSGLMQMLTRN